MGDAITKVRWMEEIIDPINEGLLMCVADETLEKLFYKLRVTYPKLLFGPNQLVFQSERPVITKDEIRAIDECLLAICPDGEGVGEQLREAEVFKQELYDELKENVIEKIEQGVAEQGCCFRELFSITKETAGFSWKQIASSSNESGSSVSYGHTNIRANAIASGQQFAPGTYVVVRPGSTYYDDGIPPGGNYQTDKVEYALVKNSDVAVGAAPRVPVRHTYAGIVGADGTLHMGALAGVSVGTMGLFDPNIPALANTCIARQFDSVGESSQDVTRRLGSYQIFTAPPPDDYEPFYDYFESSPVVMYDPGVEATTQRIYWQFVGVKNATVDEPEIRSAPITWVVKYEFVSGFFDPTADDKYYMWQARSVPDGLPTYDLSTLT